MAEQEKYWWEDKTIQIPKGLLIAGVPAEATGTYAKMKGFGAEVRCGLKALAVRCDWAEATARRWQGWLWENGWIVLLREGENKEPRQWWMNSAPGELPPQEVVTRVSKNGTLPPQGILFNQGDEKAAPGKTLPKANKALQANKDSNNQANKDGGGKHPDQDAFWTEAKAHWKARTGSALHWPGQGDQPAFKDFQGKLAAALTTLGKEEMLRRWFNMLNDDFTKALSLRAFFADLAAWAGEPRKKGAGPGARPFHQPTVTERAPSLRAPHAP